MALNVAHLTFFLLLAASFKSFLLVISNRLVRLSDLVESIS